MRIPLIKITSNLCGYGDTARRVGSDVHDELMIDESSGSIYYFNLQCGGTSQKYKCEKSEYEFDYIPEPIDGCEKLIEFVTLRELIIIGFKEWLENRKNERLLKRLVKLEGLRRRKAAAPKKMCRL